MSRDSSHTYVHMHASLHADLFEEFCHPPSASAGGGPNSNHPSSHAPHHHQHNHGGGGGGGSGSGGTGDPSMVQVPGHFLPFEEIQLPPHLMPVNPEDEDDVVPHMHAAFGIQRALTGAGAGGEGMAGTGGDLNAAGTAGGGGTTGRGAQQEPVWRDLGMERLMDSTGTARGSAVAGDGVARREGKKAGLMMMR